MDQRLDAVFRFNDLKAQRFDNSARDLANDAGIVNHQAGLHFALPF
jgi:hypothetical protein